MKLNDEKVKQIEDTMKLKDLQIIQMKEEMNQMKEKLKKLEDTIESLKSALNDKMGKQSSSEMGDTIFQDYSASATKEQESLIKTHYLIDDQTRSRKIMFYKGIFLMVKWVLNASNAHGV